MLNNFFKFRRLFIALLIVSVLAGSTLALAPTPALAQQAVVSTETASVPQTVAQVKLTFFQKLTKTLSKIGSKIFLQVLNKALSKLAMDSAKYIGSGGNGQKPLFDSREWGQIASDAGDAALGAALDGLGKQWAVNLCSPNLDVKVKIGLGLTDYSSAGSLTPAACDFKNMKAAWSTEFNKWQSMRATDYLSQVGNMFTPTGNDMAIALNVIGTTTNNIAVNKGQAEANTRATNGWLDLRDPGGKLKTTPGAAPDAKAQAEAAQTANFGKATGNAFVDAGNIFLNQLAMSAFKKAMSAIADPKSGQAINCFFDKAFCLKNGQLVASTTETVLTSPNADVSAYSGASNLDSQLAKIIKPEFGVQADYDVLGDLASCPDTSNIGPTNCVLDDNFRQGIEEQSTVIDAINKGYLNKDWRFLKDVDYNNGYSLRDLMILRKYRIIPLGWEEAVAKATELKQTPTLMDLINCYDPADNYSGPYSTGFTPGAWCEGLVDPLWVLKAPLQYCKKQGPGAQVLSVNSIPAPKDDKGNATGTAEVFVTRAEDYCADEQSCIKEKGDGSCSAYGYCTQEKRIWKFGSDSCDPINNSCSVYNLNGASYPYLENTIDFTACADDSAIGCKAYSQTGAYNLASSTIAWQPLNYAYFNRQAKTCSASVEGCTQLLRFNNGDGNNLYQGLSSFNIASLTFSTSSQVIVGPSDYNIAGEVYNLSFSAENCDSGSQASFGTASDFNTANLSTSTAWQFYSLSYVAPYNIDSNQVVWKFNKSNITPFSSCEIKNLKVEKGSQGTVYSAYGANPTYEKLLPNYLASTCYNNVSSTPADYSLKTNAPAVCNNYARLCNQAEVGCDKYTNPLNNFSVSARAVAADYCSGTCAGYDTFVSSPSYFEPTSTLSKFIPKTATACTAAAVGCSAFTNVDAVANGGEGTEYYSYLRQCIKPTSTCATFYAWENTGTGPQLRTYSLKSDSSLGADSALPQLINGRSNGVGNSETDQAVPAKVLCDTNIFNLPASDPSYNPDCRQFYNKAGGIAYRLIKDTISCSDSCQPYRLAGTLDAGSCTAIGGTTQTTANNDCLIYAVPGEGTTCSSAEVGCREYNGNSGNNTRIVTSLSGADAGAFKGYGATVASSSESLKKNGSSLYYKPGGGNSVWDFSQAESLNAKIAGFFKNLFDKLVGPVFAQTTVVSGLPTSGVSINLNKYYLRQGSGYVIKFLAKATTAVNDLSFSITNGDSNNQRLVFSNKYVASQTLSIPGNNTWAVYTVNLDNLSLPVGTNESLIINAGGAVFLDNLVLTEISDRYYLVKDSWQTPDECYYDLFGNYQGVNYNLGCQAYTNLSGKTNYLRQFSALCSDNAVGCEPLINTYNSASPTAQSFASSSLNVPADKFIYAVYDSTKLCNSADKGCKRLGQQLGTNQYTAISAAFADTYIYDDPDQYDQTLCSADSLSCEEYTDNNGATIRFKNPGDNTCEWRQAQNSSVGTNAPYRWYKSASTRCSATTTVAVDIHNNPLGAYCKSDTDCPGGQKCISDTNDYLCPVDSQKTIGYGNSLVWQPTGYVGLCDESQVGCGEYIDPMSDFSPTLVYSGAWDKTAYTQKITLARNKLYVFNVSGAGNDVSLDCFGSINLLNSDNTFTATNSLKAPANTPTNILFNSLNNKTCTLNAGSESAEARVKVAESVIDYQLSNNIDLKSCTVPNKDNGCILFNERRLSGVNGYSLATNKYSALSVSQNSSNYSNCGANCDSNQLIKVTPSRVCGKWLACISSYVDPTTKNQTCFAVGECDALTPDGQCADPVISGDENTHVFNAGNDRNTTGYSIADQYYLANMKEVGTDVNTAHWSLEDASGRMGISGGIDYIDEQVKLGRSTVKYPAEGRVLGRITDSSNKVEIGPITVVGTQEYYLNLMVNTKDLNGAPSTINFINQRKQIVSKYTLPDTQDWQRVVAKFKPFSGDTTIKIEISTNDNNLPLYVDDLNVEPVLQTGTTINCADGDLDCDCIRPNADSPYQCTAGGYSAKSCRLYPNSEALSCESKATSENAVEQKGLYGYCLENDPKNPGVCLMWYPIDNVRSSQAGEAPVSALPDLYYCSQADLDIDIVMHIKPAAYYTAWIIYGNGAHYPNSAGAPWTSECSKDCNGTAEADADAWGFDIGPYCTYQPDYYHCICTVSDNQNLIIPTVKHDEWIYGIEGTAQKCGQAYGNHTYDSWLWPRLVEGWYRYMGNYKDFKSIKDQSNIEILDYSMNSSDCDTAGGEWHEGASTILGSSWYTSDGNGVPGKVSDFDNNVDKIMSGRSGCLLPVSKYKLKCSYTKADKLWVNRIKYPMNDNPFGSTDPYYKFASSTFWGGQMVPPADNNLVGPIYGCNSKNYDALGNSYCQYLKYSDNGAYLSLDSNHQANDNLYGNNSTWANQNAMTNNLNLFWNLDRSPNDTNGYSKNPSIECGGSNSRPASACFVKPTITPIQIFNSQGKLVTSNPPTLTGVYTITFGVSVDKEQAPIKKLDINLRDGQHIVWTNIDSASKLTFIHRYDSVPADINKKVTVDVVDGWDVETCSAGVPAGCQ